MNVTSVAIIGTGLIGTSLGLRLTAIGVDVLLYDIDEQVTSAAAQLGAGRPGGSDNGPVDLVLICVPPSETAKVLYEAQNRGVGRYYTDVASVKAPIVAQSRALACDLRSYVPGHPVAGAECSGPRFARGDMFANRAWALCPTEHTEKAALDIVLECVELAGGIPLFFAPAQHDETMALVSHAPHLVSSAIAALFREADPLTLTASGTGLRDVTRIAKGDVALWSDIIVSNRAQLCGIVRQVAAHLNEVAAELEALPPRCDPTGSAQVRARTLWALLRTGVEGRQRIEQAQQVVNVRDSSAVTEALSWSMK